MEVEEITETIKQGIKFLVKNWTRLLFILTFCTIIIAVLPLRITTRAIAGLSAVALIAFIIYSILSVGPDEIGIKILFGKITDELCDSGLHLVPKLPQCYIAKIPKTRFELGYAPRLVISKRGEWGPEEDRQKFGKQLLLITATIYTEFGREIDDVKAVIEKKIPTTEEGLIKVTDSLVDSAFRDAGGSMTWGEATEIEGREKIRQTVKEVIGGDNSYFRLGGFNLEKTDIVLRVVDLQSETLKKAMAEPDIERFQAEGAEYEAERLLRETEVLGKIKTALTKKGFSNEKAQEIAHNIYELQVSADVQRETGMEAVKLVRFQTGNSGNTIAAAIAEALTAFGAARGLLEGRSLEKKKRVPQEEKRLIEERQPTVERKAKRPRRRKEKRPEEMTDKELDEIIAAHEAEEEEEEEQTTEEEEEEEKE